MWLESCNKTTKPNQDLIGSQWGGRDVMGVGKENREGDTSA